MMVSRFDFKLYLSNMGFRGFSEGGRDFFVSGSLAVVFLKQSDLYQEEEIDLTDYPIRYEVNPYRQEINLERFMDWHNSIKNKHPFFINTRASKDPPKE